MPWALEVARVATDERRGGIVYKNLKINRRINGATIVSYDVDPHSAEAGEITLADRKTRLFDTELNLMRFHGRNVQPLERVPGAIKVTAASPLGTIDTRFLNRRYHKSNKPLGTIMKQLVDAEHARSPLSFRLAADPTGVGPATDADYDKGKDLESALNELTTDELDDGLWVLESPVDGDATYWSELTVRYPESGVLTSASFVYDHDAGGNCVDYRVTEELPVNAVQVFGKPNDERDRYVYVTDAQSVLDYGLIESQVVFSDVKKAAQLTAMGLATLTPGIRYAFEFVPLPGGDLAVAGGQYVPRLWRDFDVGDFATLTIKDGATEFYDLVGRIAEVQMSVSDNGATEQLDRITLEVVG